MVQHDKNVVQQWENIYLSNERLTFQILRTKGLKIND